MEGKVIGYTRMGRPVYEISGGRGPAQLLIEEIGYGILGGVAAGLLIAAIIKQAGRRGLIAPAWRQVVPAAGAACLRDRERARRVRIHRGVRGRHGVPPGAGRRPRGAQSAHR